MRILFVTPYVPSLMRVRSLNLIRQLSKRHSVTLVALAQGDESEDEALERLHSFCDGVYVLPLSRTRSFASCCRRLPTAMPLQAAYTCLSELREIVSRLAESLRFDVLHVEHIRGAHLADGVRGVPRVFDSVDCITRLLKLRLAHQRGLIGRLLQYEELLKMRAYEPRMAIRFDSVLVTTRRDKRALEVLMRRVLGFGRRGPHLDIVRNGVDCEYFRPMPIEVEPETIVFTGRMSYFPNVQAALRFREEVFPLIRRRQPKAKLRIVGSDPPDSIRHLDHDPAIEVTGYVPDLRPYLASAGVVVCPLSFGVGVQNKVLEAMAMGKPVVATSVACRGIPDAVHGRHLLRADDPAEMAETVLGLFGNQDMAAALGRGGRALTEAAYSWEAATTRLEQVYTRAVGSREEPLALAA